MKVLVTGAGGYIGSQTCKLLKKQGHTVIVCDRRPITSHNYFDSQQNENCYGDYKLKMTYGLPNCMTVFSAHCS